MFEEYNEIFSETVIIIKGVNKTLYFKEIYVREIELLCHIETFNFLFRTFPSKISN